MYFLATDLLSCLRFEFDSWFYVSLFMIRWPFFLSPFPTLLVFGLSSSSAVLCSLKELELLCVSLVRFPIWERNGPDEWMKLIRLWSTYGLAVCVFRHFLKYEMRTLSEKKKLPFLYNAMNVFYRNKTSRCKCISLSILYNFSMLNTSFISNFYLFVERFNDEI